MKQTLDTESRKALVKYRLLRAEETYSDALDAFYKGSFNSAMNRLYYACFYAVVALLIHNNIEAKTHEGVKRMFAMHFISNNKIDNKYNIYYSQIFQARIQGDYDDFFMFDKETSVAFLGNGRSIIDLIKSLIPLA